MTAQPLATDRTPLERYDAALDGFAVPESALGSGARDGVAVPGSAPPAPWVCTAAGLGWFARAGRGSRGALPAPLRRGPSLPVATGLFLRYADTPVGGYGEVLGIPRALLPGRGSPRAGACVPFIAVDSGPSIRGGREEWALPKTAARFTFPAAFAGPGPLTATATGALPDGRPWSVRATARGFGPALPLRLPFELRQAAPGGVRRAASTMRGRARLALVDVAVEGPDAAGVAAAGPPSRARARARRGDDRTGALTPHMRTAPHRGVGRRPPTRSSGYQACT